MRMPMDERRGPRAEVSVIGQERKRGLAEGGAAASIRSGLVYGRLGVSCLKSVKMTAMRRRCHVASSGYDSPTLHVYSGLVPRSALSCHYILTTSAVRAQPHSSSPASHAHIASSSSHQQHSRRRTVEGCRLIMQLRAGAKYCNNKVICAT